LALAPLRVTLETDSAAVPLLVSVTAWAALDAPTATAPKLRLVGDKPAAG